MLLVVVGPANAYIGPGAGFAIASSFLVIFVTILLAFVSILILPFRMIWRALWRPKTEKALVKRFIVLGLDGQDPRLTDRFMAEGKLPNFKHMDPDILSFQNRLLERYTLPKDTDVVVLLPCSAKKPYNQSRSHQLFYKSIKLGIKKSSNRITVWSLTSPLGVVPRELE